MTELPPEAKSLIEAFKTQEALKQAEREQSKSGLSKKERNELDKHKKAMTAREVISYASTWGLGLEYTPGGKHQTHLRAPNGLAISLPHHGDGARIASGTQKQIIKFIHEHGISPQANQSQEPET